MSETSNGGPEDAHQESTDQLTLQNPVTRYPVLSPPEQDQPEPGLDVELEPKTDRGEFSYRGTGRPRGAPPPAAAWYDARGRNAQIPPATKYCRYR